MNNKRPNPEVSELRYRRLFETAQDGILIIDAESGKITDANPFLFEMLGYDTDAIIGKKLWEIGLFHHIVSNRKAFEVLQAKSGIRHEDVYLETKSGQIRQAEFTSNTYYVGEDKILQCNIRDITERKLAEEELRKTEERYREFYQKSPIGYQSLDSEGRLIEVNQVWLDEMGYTKEEVAGRWFGDFLRPDQIDLFKKSFAVFKNTGTAATEFYMNRKDGSVVLIAFSGKIARDTKGNFKQTHCTLQDITQRHLAEEAIRESQRKYQALFESIGDAAFVCYIDDHKWADEFIELNKVASDMLGYTHEQLLSMSVKELFFSLPSDLILEETTDKLYRHKVITRESSLRHKCGQAIPVEMTFHLFDLQGKPAVLTLARDITSRKEAARELEQSHSRLVKAEQVAGFGYWEFDLANGLVYPSAGAREIYGLESESITIPFVQQIPLSEYRSDLDKAMNDLIKHKIPYDIEFKIKRSTDGAILYIHSIAEYDAKRNLVFGTIQDITKRKQAEELLRESEARFRSTFDQSPIGAAIYDLGFKYRQVNDKFCKMLDYSDDELTNLSVRDITHPDDWPKDLIHLNQLKNREISRYETDKRYIHKSGSIFWVHLSVAGIRDAGGNLLYYLAMIVDITARKEAEDALQKYKLIAEDSRDIILFLDRQTGRILEANTAAVKSYGYSRKQLLSMRIQDLRAPQARILSDSEFEQAYAHGMLFETMHRRKDGSTFPVEVSSRGADIEGTTTLINIIRDTTERKQAEKALSESLQSYQVLFNSVTDAILVYQPEAGYSPGKFIEMNDAAVAMLGYSRQEMLQMNPLDVVSKGIPTVNVFKDTMRQAEKNSELVAEQTLKTKSGETIPVELHSRMFEFGGKHMVITLARDISERKRLEEEQKKLRHQSEMSSRLAAIGEMAAGIAHEINNPLTGVIGFASILMDREDLPPDAMEQLQIINSGSQRVVEIVKRMLTFARQSKPVRSSINITELIDNTLELRSYVLKTANIDVVRHYEPGLPLLTVDSGQIQQVILNLILNAEYSMKKAHEKGTLTITVSRTGDRIRMSFRDNGMGMSAETLGKLFQPFFTTKEPGEGSGLGLSLSHGIILEHDGTIRGESIPGEGAEFIVELPIKLSNEKSAISNQDSTAIEPTKKASILAVDDEPAIRSLIRIVLTQDGYQVDECEAPQEAMEMISKHKYDAILLDIRMPGMSGLELYSAITAKWPKMAKRVIFITGDTSGKLMVANDIPCINKPFNIAVLKDTLLKILSQPN
ncbi:MAG: PAS domain S-box protein [Dehalococcoides mccartyi]|uniref:PAS domain S-box protein n=1 Tax=Dehalococcoides TaxID=61434 RepID=UPI0019FECF75|nr:PAS domain S-box protein [Dehalococcoides mccartyi]MBF4483079.1 PAS domain S-box protein [Dehalococcoides mccartyi]MBJ7531921.1 PAS domain S-box protein [Dehalococcoides mccartyi]MDP4280372.1 PAS domain S-box protein [Dehalococcoides mccartyi]